MRIYQCTHCGGQLLALRIPAAGPLCGGRLMEVAQPQGPGQGDHRLLASRGKGAVYVWAGQEAHPMEPEHHLRWIALERGREAQIHWLSRTEGPGAVFRLERAEAPFSIYADCSLHGLWKAAF